MGNDVSPFVVELGAHVKNRKVLILVNIFFFFQSFCYFQAIEALSKFVEGEITTPHIFFNDKHIPGYSQLISLVNLFL